jgi:hypothetical protein
MSALIPIGLFVLALAIRVVVAGEMPFPITEPSAYYVGVAQNLLAGNGLVTDGVWSYATPPLEVPKPAFELWLPMSTFVSAAAMAVLGSSFWAAQLGGALLGATVAPLAWAIGREATQAHGLDGRRGGAVAITSGLLAAVLSPLVLGSAVPDSYTPFTVFVLAGALLVPRVVGVRYGRTDDAMSPSVIAGLALGVALGLAYLSRQEVIWLGLTVVLMLAWAQRARAPGSRLRQSVARLWPVVVGGLLVVLPWLVRNWLDLGSPLPGQAIENMFLVDNEDIFAFRDRPDASTYLGQGLATILVNPITAAWDGLLNVIVLPAFPVGLVGLLALVGMRRSPALRGPTALVAVLVSAALTFGSTMLLFPVATRWGTFMHASGPLLVALGVVAALGGDALVARISETRRWQRPNIILAPVALLLMAGLFTAFSVSVSSRQSGEVEARYAALAVSLQAAATAAGQMVPETLISDHPMWLADALGRQTVALPDEAPDAIIELSRAFEAPWVVVVDERGRYPGALLDPEARGCLAADPVPLEAGTRDAWLFRLAHQCASS